MNRLITLLFFSLFLIACGSESTDNGGTSDNGNASTDKPPAENVKKDYSKVSEDEKKMAASNFLLPSPGEALTALGKLGNNVDWYKLGAFDENSSYSDKADRALNLGVRVADAFVAINAKDKGAFAKMSKAIFEISDDLDISDVLLKSKKRLNKLADSDKWKAMQFEMDNIHEEAQRKLEKNDKELVVLASIGGWLEGLNVASGHLKDNYNDDNSKLLCQGELLSYYKKEMNALSGATKSNAKVKAVVKAVSDLGAIVDGKEDVVIPQSEVQKMYDIGSAAISAITK